MKVYGEGGLNALRSRYGLDCSPRIITPPCDTCFTCRRTIAKTKALGEPEHMHCQIGEMSIQADIGPSWNVNALSYWKRPPVEPPRLTHTRSGELLKKP